LAQTLSRRLRIRQNLPIPEQQRATVEKLSGLMASDGKLDQNLGGLPLASQQIQ